MPVDHVHCWSIHTFDYAMNDPGRTRTCNPRLRGPMPYPLGHGATVDTHTGTHTHLQTTAKVSSVLVIRLYIWRLLAQPIGTWLMHTYMHIRVVFVVHAAFVSYYFSNVVALHPHPACCLIVRIGVHYVNHVDCYVRDVGELLS